MKFRFFYNSGIQLKLVTIISLIIILSITGIIIAATYFFKKDNEVRIKENALEVTQLISSKTKADISLIIREANFMAGEALNQSLIGIPKKSLKDTSESLYEGEEILAIYIYDKASKPSLITSIYNNYTLNEKKWSQSKLNSLVAKHLNSFAKASKGEIVIHNSSFDSIPVLGLSHPFRENENAGFFVALCAMDKILSSLRYSGITDNFILSGDGTILAHTNTEPVVKHESLRNTELFEKIQKSPINNGQFKYKKKDNEFYIASFRKLGIGDLTVVTEVSEERAMEEVNNIQRRNFLLLGIILNLSIFVVLVYSKKLTKPILKLVDATHQIEKGNFQLQIQETSGDEIGRLTRSFVDMARGLAERDKVKDAFSKFVNTDLAEQALHGEIKLGGSRRECTVFFSDIRDFTANSEVMEPEEVVEFLNDYMTVMVECVNRNGGIVDKFIGDSIMAVWGAVRSSENDTAHAIQCALDMRKALIDFNAKKRSKKYPFVRIGVGINTGFVVAGQIGSEERLEFTVIGDTVNLASRIESLNKEFNTDILVSESAYEKTKHLFVFEKMKAIQVKGKRKPQTIYAVLGKKDDTSAPKTLAELRKLIGIGTDISKSTHSLSRKSRSGRK